MTTKRPDYTEARNYYIKGEGNECPTLQDIATEFNYSLSTLRKQAANEGWLKKRKERLKLKLFSSSHISTIFTMWCISRYFFTI